MDMFGNNGTCGRKLRSLTIGLLLLVLLPGMIRSEDRYIEEIIVSFEVPRLLKEDIFVQYDGNTVYVPLVSVLTLLDIHVKPQINKGLFTGELFGETGQFEINVNRKTATCFGQEHYFDSTAYVMTETDLYLRVDLYKKIFDLPITFSFSNLSLHMPLNTDLPAYQRLKRKMAHENLRRQVTSLKNVEKIPYRREYLKGAVADWMITTSPVGGNKVHYFSLTAGGMLLGGDMTLSGTGNTRTGINTDQMNYRWHYAFNENPYVTQMTAGEINTDGAFSRSLEGVKVTNRPLVQRRYFQTISLSDFVGEGWEVELYVNNRLTDFTVTGEDGEYNFLVDVYYGSSRIMLKFYGPNGQIRTEEQYLKVPYTLIPEGTFEYTVATGLGKYSEEGRKFIQGSGYYGALPSMTIGLSAEAAMNPEEGQKPAMAVEVNQQVLGNLVASAGFVPSDNAKLSLNFSEPSIININASLTKYFENPYRNPFGHRQNVIFSASSPLKIGQHYLGLRYYVSYDKYIDQESIGMNYGFSSSFSLVHLNYIGKFKRTLQLGQTTNSISSQLIASIRGIPMLSPQIRADYDHNEKQLTRIGVNITKRLFRTAQLSVSYDRNILSKINSITVSLNFFSTFADFSTRMLHAAGQTSVSESQRGSVLFDQESTSVRFDRRSGVGFGSAVVKPFVDDNYNGMYDEGEEYVRGIKANIKGVGGRPYGSQRFYYYDRLQPYDEYVVQIDPYSVDNPLLKPVHENYKVSFSPNVVTPIDVPLVLGGEVSGYVRRESSQGTSGIGGIRVVMVNLSRETVTTVTTFNNGEFYYLGLLPGKYRAYIDPDQLERYGYKSVPPDITFEMEQVEGGAIVGDVNFTLAPK